jgi:hypothetical protein
MSDHLIRMASRRSGAEPGLEFLHSLLVGGEEIMDEGGSNAGNLVRGDARSHTAAT